MEMVKEQMMRAGLKMRKARVGAVVTLVLFMVFQQNLLASEGAEEFNQYGGQQVLGEAGTVAGDRGTSSPRDEQIKRLQGRIDYLESQVEELQKQVIVMTKQLGQNRTLANLVREARSLASDSWDIAVEARSIATRAEQKADKALRDKE